VIGAYLCTPLVKFPVSALKPTAGKPYRGTTIGEFGAGSRPIDMILVQEERQGIPADGQHHARRDENPDRRVGTAAPITMPVTSETGGVPFEKVPSMARVQQLDLLDATHSVGTCREQRDRAGSTGSRASVGSAPRNATMDRWSRDAAARGPASPLSCLL